MMDCKPSAPQTDSWAHFTQGSGDIEKAFSALGYSERLRLIEPGKRTSIEFGHMPG